MINGAEISLRKNENTVVPDEWIEAFRSILQSIRGEDADREGLLKTPRRAAKAMIELIQGYQESAEEVIGDAIFHSNSDELVIVKDINVHSLCEHHLLPFLGKVHVAYIPRAGRIVGLSKIPRIVRVYARRFQVQERLTKQIGEALQEILDPHGVAVIVDCRHMCMEMRGIEKIGASTWTQFRSGVFKDSKVWADFVFAVRSSEEISINASTSKTKTLQTASSSFTTEESKTEPSSCELLEEDNNEANNYRLYQSCCGNEFTIMADIVVESITGPTLDRKKGLSCLDIGAGNGRLLEHLREKLNITRYVAFEQEKSLCTELEAVVAKMDFEDGACLVQNDTFTEYTKLEQKNGAMDLILLSHCLYYSNSKELLVQKALTYLAPGGVLFVFHRWSNSETLATLSANLHSLNTIHNFRVFEVCLDLKCLSSRERYRLSAYSNASFADELPQSKVIQGCIAIENLSTSKTATLLNVRKISHEAQRKYPSIIVAPGSIAGIQSCVWAACYSPSGKDKISVVGGGHSPNCYSDNAIVVDMQKWNDVVVDPISRIVRVGGGATIGEITQKCEEHGLVVPLGDRPSVGMGLVLQGGINHFMRTFGLACDNILRVWYVAPSGECRTAKSSGELFPFKGAGPNFGIVTEIELRAHKLPFTLTQSTIYEVSHSKLCQTLSSYSDLAHEALESLSIDGFLYWSRHDKIAFATSSYETMHEVATKKDSLVDLIPAHLYSAKTNGKLEQCKPTELFDKELYMTESFHPNRAARPGESPPQKLHSLKRCLLLLGLSDASSICMTEIFYSAPTKWSYVHFLHGGGAVSRVEPTKTAFGCRDWTIAAVITGRYPKDDRNLEVATQSWLDAAVEKLKPFCVGVYGTDLGPTDTQMARYAFGYNSQRLAELKRMQDPLNLFCCSCPLLDENPENNDTRFQTKGVVVIFCGRRCVGKDWLALRVKEWLIQQGHNVSVCGISDTMKRSYAKDNPDVDAERLIADREYKELHRAALTEYYQARKAENPGFDSHCFVEAIRSSSAGILLMTGMRDGLSYARRLAGRAVVLVKVCSSHEARKRRGWIYAPFIDNSTAECSADEQAGEFWDAVYNNDIESTAETATEWIINALSPAILKRCVRLLPDIPRPGVVYKDLVGGILRQPFGLKLISSTLLSAICKCVDRSRIDVIVAPEATAFLFAAPLAMLLNVPLVPVRKGGRTPGDVVSVKYEGSNIHNLRKSDHCQDLSNDKNVLEISDGLIQYDQRVLLIDDLLATGSTCTAIVELLRKQGVMTNLLGCVAELPDLQGRNRLKKMGVDVVSIMQFDGE